MEVHSHGGSNALDQRGIGVGNQVELPNRGSVTQQDDGISPNGAALVRNGGELFVAEFVSTDTIALIASLGVFTHLVTDSVDLFAFVDV